MTHGHNLTLTVRAIVAALEKSNGRRGGAGALARADGGGTGVIFSQIVRGFADVLGEHDRSTRDDRAGVPVGERCRLSCGPAPVEERC
jgi:dihydroxyacetone kinase-like predicted kinase